MASQPRPQPRQCIADLADYPLGAPITDASLTLSHLDNNEHWLSPSPKVIEAITHAAGSANYYSEGSARNLRQQLAERHGLNADGIVCGNGSSELISMLCRLFCNPGDEIVVGPYSYMYFRTSAQVVDANIVMPEISSVALDVASLAACVTERTRIVFVDNPQNPVGVMSTLEQITNLHTALPKDVVLVLDSAYAEYVDNEHYDAGAGMVEEFDNVVMLRTFSKVHGLAGLRIGWGYFPIYMANLMHRFRQPNNLSSLSVAAASAAMNDELFVEQTLKHAHEARTYLADGLTALGFAPYPSQTNFVLAKIPEGCSLNAKQIDSTLRSQGVMIRSMAGYHLPDHIRITVAEYDHIDRTLDAIRALI
ncbi:MAG: aminotransferase class I/II-fold pyridoxal phosphate-dependent enzyme [Pseudomonadota bacterium]